ncbi:hypothetical protein PR202_gb03658 [Eleusine coracana subsp. coracana]|uniref:Peroxidase n=1 Tax=Eleusine coracana subsp. coracana TaxID=191504 RepID=A0AAV5E3E9_ELECO|nr:hypothetical protein PR202_gb03658 [Eleusine coracana subsp. coracana]
MAGSRASSLVVVAVVLVIVIVMVAAASVSAERYPPLAPGLSFDFYKKSCPKAESIVKDFLSSAVKQNPGLIPALIRIHFHDCFVQGCDGSVLLDNSSISGTSEKTYIPNQTLRPAAFKAINDIRNALEKACGRVVSCADIAALTARDSVQLAGGPSYKVPLGRRDGLSPASETAVLTGLPAPTSNVTELMDALSKIKLDITDLVALSGGHTVGIAHCNSFDNRLFPARDPTMDQWFFTQLNKICPLPNTDKTTVNDIRTPHVFDNKYYVDLLNRQGLFTSDQVLNVDARTKDIVHKFAVDQNAFFDQFVYSYVKMGQIQVLTGSQGQIRANCAARNPPRLAWSIVDTLLLGL